MTSLERERALAELELTRLRRELLFWTLRQWLATTALAGATGVLLMSFMRGGRLDVAHVLTSGGIASAGIALRRRSRDFAGPS